MNKRICNTMPRIAMSVLAVMIAWAMAPGARSWAGESAPIPLPPPQTDGGKPLMQALGLRATSRAFAPDPIPAQTLSNLLWAAWGINRPADGTFLYDVAANRLRPVATGDHRALAGIQPFVKNAPLTLLMVADTSRMKGAAKDPDQRQ
jgi:hypothetical protein